MKKSLFAKRLTLSLITCISMGLLTACSDDSNDGDGVAPQVPDESNPITPSQSTLLEIIEKNDYDPTEFGDVIGNWPMLSVAGDGVANLLKPSLKAVAASRIPQMDALFNERVGTAEDGTRQWNVKRIIFSYKGISGTTGNDTTLVGSVIFPTNTLGKAHRVDVLTLYHHQAYFDESWLPSRSVTLMGMHALHNSAVIEPDGQGAIFDIKEMGGFLRVDRTALQMSDCVVAALEVMKQENVTLAADGYSNNWGTSLGALGATAFAYYLEKEATPELKQLFRVRATYIGEGPAMLSQINVVDSTYNDPQKYYYEWSPEMPFYISLSPDDELISYDMMQEFYKKLRTMPDGSTNDKVHWTDFKLPAMIQRIISSESVSEKVYGIGNHLLSAVVLLYAASIVNDPSDIEDVLGHENWLLPLN